MSSGLYSGVSGLALGSGLYRNVSGLWGGASGLTAGFGGGSPYGGASLYLDFLSGSLDSRITFTRGSNATLTDSTGKVTYAPANLVAYSEQFDNAAWTKSSSTVTQNAATAPDGTTTADKLIASAAAAIHYTDNATNFTGTYLFSVYAKAAEYTTFAFARNTDSSAIKFDLSNGTVLSTGSAWSSATITSVGNGWYRCSGIITLSAARVYISPNTAISFTGDGTSGIYLWGAQLEPVTYQTTPGTYVATTSTAYYGPRFDYDPVTLAPKGLLIEEQRTNLLTYSEQFDNAAWQKTNATVTANSTTAPDGTATADTAAATTAAATALLQQVAAVASTSAAYSIYIKRGSGDTDANKFLVRNVTTLTNLLEVSVNYATGAITYVTGSSGASIVAVGNGWWRLTLTVTSGLTSGNTVNVYPCFTGGSETASEFAYIWGAQLEAGAFATSYIPTVASTVTRSADVATMTGTNFSSWYNQNEGTFVFGGAVRGSPGASTVNFVQASNGVSVSVAIELGMFDLSAPLFQVTNGTTQASLDLGSMSVDTVVKMAGAYKVNDFAGVLNGGTVQTDAVGSVPAGITQMGIGNRLGGVYMNGWLRQIAYFNTRLPDAQLQTLTAPSAVTTLSLDFTSGSYTVGY